MAGQILRPGDLARLKSGGPIMVVAGYETGIVAEGYACFWSIQGALRREIIPEEVLVKVGAEPTAPAG
jgi:uncharacterized protein YodC (DUF2158 family)